MIVKGSPACLLIRTPSCLFVIKSLLLNHWNSRYCLIHSTQIALIDPLDLGELAAEKRVDQSFGLLGDFL